MLELWIGTMASAVALVAFFTIAASLARRLLATKQDVGDNPLAWATTLIFASFAVHHGLHVAYGIGPALSGDASAGAAYGGWLVSIWDVLSALAGVWYLTAKARYPASVGSPTGDLRARQQQALDIHDSIVQGLAIAKMSIELNRTDEGLVAVQQALDSSRRIITDLIGEGSIENTLRPGELRRGEHARGRSA